MKTTEQEMMYQIREQLAAQQHAIWAHWMKHLFSIVSAFPTENGGMTIPYEKVSSWWRQMDTPYKELTEQEKDSDREQADKIIELLNLRLSK